MSETLLNIERIQQLIANRPPYLMLDRARIDEPGKRGVGVKNITVGEAYFNGHFPAHPILPGVLQVEAMTQLGVLLLRAAAPMTVGHAFLYAADKIKFRRPVTPGDQLVIQAEVTEAGEGRWQIVASTAVDGQLTSEAELTIGFLDPAIHLMPRDLTPPLHVTPAGDSLDTERIMAAIPHRFPFLLIDRVISMVPKEGGGGRFVALKNIAYNEPVFRAWDSEHPFLPSYLVPEIAAQAGCAYLMTQPENHGKIGYFMSIDNSVFLRPILPGDQMIIDTELTVMRQRFGRGTATIYVGDDIVATTEIKVTMVDQA